MRYSQLLIPTVKEVPAEAEVPSHQLMIRAGFIRKVASGTYTYLPLGWRCLLKIIAIVRQEMNAAGAQEILAPILQPIELWQQTGRNKDYGPNLCQFTDRHGRVNALSPTAEEVVTSLVAGEVNSYKQLPINLYQISTKFRDEFRPRFGVLRSREFIMKDAYSFDATVEGLNKTYDAMYSAYVRIFKRCGLVALPVEADSGPIGGSASHEFMVPCSAGEDIIVHTEDMSYAANIEKAEVDAVAGDADLAGLRAAVGAPVEIHTPNVGSIEAVCNFMSTKPRKMIKTLIFWLPSQETALRLSQAFEAVKKALKSIGLPFDMGTNKLSDTDIKVMDQFLLLARAVISDGRVNLDSLPDNETGTAFRRVFQAMHSQHTLVKNAALDRAKSEFDSVSSEIERLLTGVIVRGDHEVNSMKLNRITGQKLELVPDEYSWVIKFLTGAAVGFAGPQRLSSGVNKFIVDHAVAVMVSGIAGANKTDYHVKNIVPGRDFPLSGDNVVVADIRNAAEGDTHQGRPLKFSRGIEVGHVFKLGTKYSEKLGAKFLDEKQESHPCIMGCYGIGVNRILASAIEMAHDENGCVLPISIAPFEVLIVPINADKAEVKAAADKIYTDLAAAGVEVLLDDRDARPGVKFKDADLIGIPLRIVVGEKGLKEGKVEIKRRTEPKPALIGLADATGEALKIVQELKQALK